MYKYTPGRGEHGSDFTLDWTDDFNSFNSSRWSKGNWTFEGNRVDLTPNNIYTKDGMLILALTRKGQESFNGQVPVDNEPSPISSSSNVTPPSSSSVTPPPSSSSVVMPPLSSSSIVTPPFSSSVIDAIPQMRAKQLQDKETHTVNAKGARVNNTRASDPRNRYRVNFKF